LVSVSDAYKSIFLFRLGTLIKRIPGFKRQPAKESRGILKLCSICRRNVSIPPPSFGINRPQKVTYILGQGVLKFLLGMNCKNKGETDYEQIV
jgi:hypothetical protein